MLGALRRRAARKKLGQALKGFELPSFPGAVNGILERIRDPDATTAAVGRALATDPRLSIKVLSLVNSAAYGLRRPIDSAEHAVKLLGKAELEAVVIAQVVRQILPTSGLGTLQPGQFWRAAARRAAFARELAERLHPATSGSCFTAALLQDMAVPLLARVQGPPYEATLTAWHNGAECLATLERERFGFDHAEIAGEMCVSWSIPERLRHVILTHHGGEAPPAVRLASMLGETEEHPGGARLCQALRDSYGMDDDAVESVCRSAAERAANLAAILA